MRHNCWCISPILMIIGASFFADSSIFPSTDRGGVIAGAATVFVVAARMLSQRGAKAAPTFNSSFEERNWTFF